MKTVDRSSRNSAVECWSYDSNNLLL